MGDLSANIDTGKVTGRRQLHFDSIDQMLADVDALVVADKAGRLKRIGNWTLGQTLNHLATWMEFAFTGSPLNPPFFIRWLIRMKRKQFFVGPMPAGVKIPGVPGGSLGTQPAALEEALPRFCRAAERLKREAPTMPHNLFGRLSHADWQAINLRHAELHLSFLQPA